MQEKQKEPAQKVSQTATSGPKPGGRIIGGLAIIIFGFVFGFFSIFPLLLADTSHVGYSWFIISVVLTFVFLGSYVIASNAKKALLLSSIIVLLAAVVIYGPAFWQVGGVYRVLAIFFGIIFLILVFIGIEVMRGKQWLTSGGKILDENTWQAKSLQAVIGLPILFIGILSAVHFLSRAADESNFVLYAYSFFIFGYSGVASYYFFTAKVTKKNQLWIGAILIAIIIAGVLLIAPADPYGFRPSY